MKGEDDKKWDQFLQQVRDFQSGTRKKYPDLLLERLSLDPKWGPGPNDTNAYELLPTEQREIRREIQRLRQQYIDRWMQFKWELLFITFGMDPKQAGSMTRRAELAEKLIERHVRCFKVDTPPPKPKKGRPSRFGPYMGFDGPMVLAVFVVAGVNKAWARYAKTHNMTDDEFELSTAIKNLDPRFRAELKTARGKPMSDGYIGNQYRKGMKLLNATMKGLDAIERTPLQELGERHIIPKPD